MGKQYTNGCFALTDNAGSPVTTAISASSIEFGLNTEIAGGDSGQLYEDFQSIIRQDPTATITTKAIATTLGFIGLNGQCVGTGQNVTIADVFWRRMSDCQTSLGGTPHIRDRVSQGLLVLGTLTADRGQDATLTIMLHAITDGTNAPVARTDGVALPTTIVTERFTLGLPAIDGSTYPEIEGVTLEFGVQITEKTPSLGSIWTDAVGVQQVRPVVTFRGRDLSKVTHALQAAGAASAAHADTLIQLIARQNAGAFQSFAGSTHIGITVNGLLVPESLGSASAGQRATTSLRLAASYDGTNAPILIDTTTTYDTTP